MDAGGGLNRIPLARPDLPNLSDLHAHHQLIEASGFQSNRAALVLGLEERLSDALGTPCRTVANGTLALELALTASGLRKGARVMVPSFTYPASVTAILRAGMQPVFGDVDPYRWLLTPEEAWRYDRQIDAVMPVCAFGAAYAPGEWADCGVPVVMDAAAGWGNQTVTPDLAAACFSLHATKALGAGEGGFVAGSDDLCATVQQLSAFGLDGTNAKMSEYAAAVALTNLAAWEPRSTARRAVAAMYRGALAEAVPGAQTQAWSPQWTPTLMPVLLPEGADPEAVAHRMSLSGVGTRRWYHPLVSLTYLQALRVSELPSSIRISGRLLGLPFYTAMTMDEVGRVVETLAAALTA